jgi:hypothetical protein
MPAIRLRFEALEPVLDERSRCRFATAEGMAAGRGGVSAAMRAMWIAPAWRVLPILNLRRSSPIIAISSPMVARPKHVDRHQGLKREIRRRALSEH